MFTIYKRPWWATNCNFKCEANNPQEIFLDYLRLSFKKMPPLALTSLLLVSFLVSFLVTLSANAKPVVNEIKITPPKTNNDLNSKTELKSNLSIGFQNSETPELSENSIRSYFQAEFELTLKPATYLTIELLPSFFYSTGYLQTGIPQNLRGSPSQFNIHHASVMLHSTEHSVEGEIGALQTNRTFTDLFGSNLSLTGAKTTLRYQWDEQQLYGDLSVFVPQTQRQTNSVYDQEQTPFLQHLSMGYEMNSKKSKIKTQIGYFKAQNLTEIMAEDASLKGNSTQMNEISGRPEFRYQFEGVDFKTKIKLRQDRSLQPLLELQAVLNQQAPQDYRLAYLIKSGFENQTRPLHWGLSYSFFKVEPDAVISTLNQSFYESNWIGQKIEGELKLKNKNILRLSASERTPLYLSPYQDHEYYFSFNWESEYELL